MPIHTPTNKSNVLIVGVGSIGERHLRCFQATERANVSICEIDERLREQVAQRYGVTRTYVDLEAALADPPDAAVVAAPAHLHIPLATTLAEAGVDLLIEKPLSVSLDGVDELEELVAEKNLRVAVAFIYRQHPALQAMRRALQSGRFGKPVQLVAVCGQHFPSYRPAYRHIYYASRATGGGAVQDALPHVLNAGEWLLGPVDRLVGDTAHQVLDGVDVEDTVHLIGRQGDVMALYSLNQHQSPNETNLTVICERGTCRFEIHRHRWRWMTQPDSPWEEESFSGIKRDDLFIKQANAFLDLLEGRAEPACSLSAAAQTLRTTLALLASVDDKQWKRTNSR